MPTGMEALLRARLCPGFPSGITPFLSHPLVKLNSSSTVSIVRKSQNSPQQGKELGSRSTVPQRGTGS